MKKYLIILFCASLWTLSTTKAQDIFPVNTGKIIPSASDSLATDTTMTDTTVIKIWQALLPEVTIHQPRYIRVLAEGGYIHRSYSKQNRKKVIRANPIGYRLEVYQSNDQRVGQQEAQRIYAKLNGRVSVPVYVRFYTPFWRVRLGDFGSLEEANNFKRSFLQQFPNMKAHTYVVRDHIRAIVIKQAKEKKE